MGAMADWYKKYQMGIVDEDTFDLEEEYETYFNEEHPIARIAATAFRAKNAIQYINDPEGKRLANRHTDSKIGELSSRMSYNHYTLPDAYGKMHPDKLKKYAKKNDRMMAARDRNKKKLDDYNAEKAAAKQKLVPKPSLV